ncbi:MAG TPA: hypothetical protein RMH99_26330 [Sandaracinaceae bacterium LLY-WYZ-13_1]|nr:hypothetical protein [Sandaracinaceae bacterium LLY-WYZ-13_1]
MASDVGPWAAAWLERACASARARSHAPMALVWAFGCTLAIAACSGGAGAAEGAAAPSHGDPVNARTLRCTSDDQCVLTGFGDCCDCCPSPAHPIHRDVLRDRRDACVEVQCVMDRCVNVDCPPAPDDDPTGAVCRDGRCVVR